MSANLRNKEYVFRNRQLTKDEYTQEIKNLETGSYKNFLEFQKEFDAMVRRAIHKYVVMTKTENSTGDMTMNAKNARLCFECYDVENGAYCYRAFTFKDAMDINNTGLGSELVYEYTSGGVALRNVKFSIASSGGDRDCDYAGWCQGSANLFGCFGMRGKQYCILNKQYTKEEYEALIPMIKKQMMEMPYVDSKGREYRYGEFFPIDMSPFPFNGSVAHEHFSFTKEQTLERGLNYREPDAKNPQIDVKPTELPDEISDIGDDILNKSIGCEHSGKCNHPCTYAFRIVPAELAMYRRIKFPIPRLCPNCRHYERLKYRNPWKLWPGKCAKCNTGFQTSYSPEKQKEYTIYCESCYNSAIV